jgi:hypothetical protein
MMLMQQAPYSLSILCTCRVLVASAIATATLTAHGHSVWSIIRGAWSNIGQSNKFDQV